MEDERVKSLSQPDLSGDFVQSPLVVISDSIGRKLMTIRTDRVSTPECQAYIESHAGKETLVVLAKADRLLKDRFAARTDPTLPGKKVSLTLLLGANDLLNILPVPYRSGFRYCFSTLRPILEDIHAGIRALATEHREKIFALILIETYPMVPEFRVETLRKNPGLRRWYSSLSVPDQRRLRQDRHSFLKEASERFNLMLRDVVFELGDTSIYHRKSEEKLFNLKRLSTLRMDFLRSRDLANDGIHLRGMRDYRGLECYSADLGVLVFAKKSRELNAVLCHHKNAVSRKQCKSKWKLNKAATRAEREIAEKDLAERVAGGYADMHIE